MAKKKLIELNDEQRIALFIKICDDIIHNLELAKKGHIGDLSDIGNEVGRAVGFNTCKYEKDLNIWAFERNDFTSGYEHGYSLQDGTHG